MRQGYTANGDKKDVFMPFHSRAQIFGRLLRERLGLGCPVKFVDTPS